MAAERIGVESQIVGLEHHIDRIYQAALAPEQWPVFLESLSRELRASTVHLHFRLPGNGDPGVDVSLGMDERFADAYRSHFYTLDPWMPSVVLENDGEVRGLESFVSESELARTEFYNDWMRPQGILHGFGAFLYKSGPEQLVSSLSGFREKSSGPFQKEDLDRIRPLVPHLQRALAIHSRVQGAESRAGATADALDRIVGGVILLDERGVAIATNRTADRIMAMNDGLVLDRDGPSASTPKQTGELRHALVGAAQTAVSNGVEAGAVMRLLRPSGRPALEVVVTPIGCESSPLFDRRATSAIFVADPDAQVDRFPERLRRLCGFTPVEGEVASRIAKGMSLTDISEDLGTSIHTVRGHLKQLFAKTDTHRQPELVRVLLTGLADLRLE
jgi:DNA-binding CsgD family transcriptional regulator